MFVARLERPVCTSCSGGTWRGLAASQVELLASLSRYRELFEASPDPMWVYDFDTLSFLAVNDEAVHEYGWSEAEFRTMSLADLLDPADVPLLLTRFRRPGPGPSLPGEWRHRTKRGAQLWVEVSAQSIEFEGRTGRSRGRS